MVNFLVFTFEVKRREPRNREELHGFAGAGLQKEAVQPSVVSLENGSQ